MGRAQEELSSQEKKDLILMIADKKNGVLDKDWSEICAEFDLNINAETLRKAGVGVKLASDAMMLGSAPATVHNLAEGYIERQKMRDLTSKVNELYRAESRSELLRETISESIKSLPEIKVTNYDVKHLPGTCANALVVGMGDFHYGAEINVTGLYGGLINQYDHKIFEARMQRLLFQLVQIIEKERPSVVHIFMVGDLIDGMLRQSQLMRLEYGVIESTMRLSEYLAQWFSQLSGYCELVVHAVSGNHSEVRPLKSKSREFPDENLERIIMWYLSSRLEDNPRITVHSECNRMTMVNVLGYNFLLLHGDGEKNIENIARDCVNMYNESIDFFICGHYHRESEYPAGVTNSGDSVIVRVPSICGVDKYAQSKGYNAYPGAIAMTIEEHYGRRCVYPIKA